jgi:uncharacterized protein (DUF2141 family)
MLLNKNYKRILFLLLFIGSITVKAQNIELTITGIRSTKGLVVIGIFKDDRSYQEEKTYMTKTYNKKRVSKGKMVVKFNLEPGTYGFTLLDDENSDGKMNYNFLGLPKEGFGFSNYEFSGLSKPKFDVFKFVLYKNRTRKIVMKVAHM